MVHLLLVVIFLFNIVLERENKMMTLCRELNDDTVFDTRAQRVYIYSLADKMVGFEETEEHAAMAKAIGWDVTMVRFKKSAHCSHIREDEGKYWAAIVEVWQASQDAYSRLP